MQLAWLDACFYTPVTIGLIVTAEFSNEEVCPNTFVHTALVYVRVSTWYSLHYGDQMSLQVL